MRYKWAVVLMLWAICFRNCTDRQAIFSVFPPLSPSPRDHVRISRGGRRDR